MALTPGTRLGPYEVVAPLGAGGMGEVYRARDTRLDREVAVKVLPSHLSMNADMRARFEREAKSVSSLNHPHICTLHDVGRQDGVDYLVMELLEGETLAVRLDKGALPTEELLRCATQVADALDRAHRQGLVHRDLKPGNVMLTKSGAKLLDFGLARVAGPVSQVSDLTRSPTVTHPLTAEGAIIGTFQYISPEQLEGKEADARSDIFSFGAVLYEMATGKRAFEGKSQASLIGAIMNTDPAPVSQVSPMSPPALDRVVKQCLAKDPEDRYQSAHDLKLQLQWIAEGGSQAGVPAPVVARRRGRERVAWALLAVVGAVAVALAGLQIGRPARERQTLRFDIAPPTSIQFQDSPRISPDGRYIAYNATDSTGVSRVWVRPMNAVSAQALAGTEGANRPFWSPDSRFLGFMAGGKLKKIPVAGGPLSVICDAPTGADGTWGRNDIILYDGRGSDPIMKVAAGGGVPSEAVTPDTSADVAQVGWPEFLPDGRHFLYLAIRPQPVLMVGDLESRDVRDLGPCESQVQYVPPGYLLYSRSGSLVVQRFDARRLEPVGEPIPIAEQVTSSPIGASDFRASDNGILVYSARRAQGGELVQVARDGRQLRTIPAPSNLLQPALSPDERRIAVRVIDDQTRSRDIWMIEPARGIASRFTFEASNENYVVWSPDGRRIAYYSDAPSQGGIYVKELTGAAEKELIHPSSVEVVVDCWSSDGRFIFFELNDPQTRSDVWVLPLGGDRKAYSFVKGPFDEYQAQLSPDGRHLAYVSDESGREEVYVQTFPDRSDKWQISTRGGSDPAWRSNGSELFYLSTDQQMMSVEVSSGPNFTPGPPRVLFPARVLFPTGPRNHYAVTKDGQTFYIVAPQDRRSLPSTTVVVNWKEEVSRR